MQSSAYWVWSTIIQGMRLFLHWCMYHFIGLDVSIGATLVHVLVYWSRSTIIYGMRLFLHCWCIYRSISLGLQSSKGCVYFCTAGASIDLSVSVYNRPRDVSDIAYIGLLVSVYNHPRDTSIGACAGLLVSVHNHPRDTILLHYRYSHQPIRHGLNPWTTTLTTYIPSPNSTI